MRLENHRLVRVSRAPIRKHRSDNGIYGLGFSSGNMVSLERMFF